MKLVMLPVLEYQRSADKQKYARAEGGRAARLGKLLDDGSSGRGGTGLRYAKFVCSGSGAVKLYGVVKLLGGVCIIEGVIPYFHS